MKLRSRKRIFICVLLLIAICVELITLQLTKAKNQENITVSITDYDANLEIESCTLTAINGEESGYYIVLPKTLNDKVVSKYFVKMNKDENISYVTSAPKSVQADSSTSIQQVMAETSENQANVQEVLIENEINVQENIEIENNIQEQNDIQKQNNIEDENLQEEQNSDNTTINDASSEINENSVDESQDEIISNENTISNPSNEKNAQPGTVELKPGDTIFLTEEEYSSKSLELTVKYDHKTVNEKVLYKYSMNKNVEGNILRIEGYMPNNPTVNVELIRDEQIIETIWYTVNEDAMLMALVKVKILENDVEFNCHEYDEKISITFEGIDSSKQYKVLEIDSEKLNDNINTMQSQQMMSTYSLDESSSGDRILASESSVGMVTADEQDMQNLATEMGITEVTEVTQTEDAVAFETENIDTYALLAADTTSGTSTFSIENVVTSGTKWDGSISTFFSGGDGTSQKPFLISEGKELAYLAEQVNNGNTFEGIYFQLTNDIDLNSLIWTPIGDYTNPFMGIFDGAGHSISNGVITTESSVSANTTYSYGIFGAIQGNSVTAEVKNTEFNNIQVTINGVANNAGVNVGIVSGTMFKKSKISNVLVKNGSITSSVSYTVSSNTLRLLVGGIVGEAINTSTDSSNPGTGNTYAIENCYASVTIDTSSIEADTSGRLWSYYKDPNYVSQVSVGGVIGRIRSQNVWPENCLVEAEINADGFIGPIFGSLYNNTTYTNQNNLNTLWNGNDAASGSNLTMTSYYANYSANGTTFTSSYTNGTTPNSTTYRRSANLTSSGWFGSTVVNIGYIQGVNKASRLTNKSSMLTRFNNYYSDDKIIFLYENGEFLLQRRITASVEEVTAFNYQILIDDPYNTNNYTYEWYINDVLDESKANTTLQEIVNESTDEDINVKVIVYDGEFYGVTKFVVPRIKVEIAFSLDLSDASNLKINASLVGTGTQVPYFDLNDYTYEWYSIDLAGIKVEKIEGADTLTLEHVEDGMEYKLIATNTKYDKLSAEGNVIVGDRNVIYLSYSNGNDSRLGDTPETSVRTMDRAYELCDSNVSRNKNVIVVMGNYTSNTSYDSKTDTNYQKNVTLTGIYGGLDYRASLAMYGSTSNYRYLNGDTTFQYMTWYGGSNQLYLYAQGYSLTIGEQVVMTSYATANPDQGLIEGNSPAVHIFAGWHQYNYATLPRNNAEIVIKSGTYGRIILGGSPGTNSANNLNQTTSRNFIGSNIDTDPYNVTVIVDIEDSTTSDNYDYDINLLVGGSACGNIIGNVVENIENGSVGRVLGGSIGDSSNIPNRWSYPINTFIGTTTINMTGGIVTEFYGGCLGRNMTAIGSGANGTGRTCDSYFYGTININISGGTVVDNIYGAGAGGVTGYSENSSDQYKSYGQNVPTIVNINISGGDIQSNVFGGGYGWTEYLTRNVIADDGGALYGDSNIIITGSPNIGGSIYAAGCGYNLTNKPNLAQMYGKSYIELNGTPTITGYIFGGGAGITNLANMAKMVGDSEIQIKCDLSTNVFGGGNIAELEGVTDLYVQTGTHTGEIYGGGNVGKITGTSNVTINGGTNNGNIYGGGNQATVTNSTVKINNGNNNNSIFGGGNQASVQTTIVDINGGTNRDVFAGGNEATVATSEVNINGGTTSNVYGGGNSAEATATSVKLQGGSAGIIYGGSNLTGDVQTTNILATSGSAGTIYGGNNAGGNVTESVIRIESGTITDVYGGNNMGGSLETSNITILDGTLNNVFGGGNHATSTTSNVSIQGGIITQVFGGGNEAEITTSNVSINGGNTRKCIWRRKSSWS